MHSNKLPVVLIVVGSLIFHTAVRSEDFLDADSLAVAEDSLLGAALGVGLPDDGIFGADVGLPEVPPDEVVQDSMDEPFVMPMSEDAGLPDLGTLEQQPADFEFDLTDVNIKGTDEAPVVELESVPEPLPVFAEPMPEPEPVVEDLNSLFATEELLQVAEPAVQPRPPVVDARVATPPAAVVLEPGVRSDIDSMVDSAVSEALEVGIPEAPPSQTVVLEPGVRSDIDSMVDSAVSEALEVGIPEAPSLPSEGLQQILALEFTEDLAILKRQAMESHSTGMLADADTAYAAGDYDQAITRYKSAYTNLGRRPETKKLRDRAKIGIAKSYYSKALILYKQQDMNLAEENARSAGDYGHPKASDLIVLIKRGVPEIPKDRDVLPKNTYVSQDTYQDSRRQTDYRIWLGRQHFQAKEYDKSQEMFEAVLKREPQNTEAIRMLKKINMLKLDRATQELEATKEGMMATLRQTWNPRHYVDIDEKGRDFATDKPKITEVDKRRFKIEEKMRSIRIPEIDFRQANINDVVEFLANASKNFDTTPVAPGEIRGVNIILKLGSAGGAAAPDGAAASVQDDPFAMVSAQSGAGFGGAAQGDIPLVTFTARELTLIEALKIVTDYCGLKYRIDDNVILIVRQSDPDDKVIHRWYPVMNFTDIVTSMSDELSSGGGGSGMGGGGRGDFIALSGGGGGGGAATAAAAGDWKPFFASMGVPWPEGSAIRYMPSLGKLMVANTADNLALFERILEQFDFVPKQIEIEARFVEVNQDDLDSLGLEFGLTDDWDMLRRKSDSRLPLASRPSIRLPANQADGGFTVGNRFLTDGIGVAGLPIADNVLNVVGVLTNPELDMVLHMMKRKGNTDLLSAPKVTAQSGSEATIKVVEEYIYPTEFTVSGITGGTTAAGMGQGMVGAVVEPGGFETREVGVLLSVLPEVSTEGQMINLTLSPEVCEFIRWEDFGSTFTDASGRLQQLRMPQPIFHTRRVQTQIMIFNNATVMMGGMITEKRASIDDKIPILGDIPLFGRLFRSRYDQSVKRNLLIFVTARMVRPDGRPVGNVEDIRMSTIAGTSAE